MNRVFVLATFIPKTCVRRLSVTQAKCRSTALDAVKKKQIQFQIDDSTPVFLKGGFKDYVFFYATIILMTVGFGISGRSLYKLANKN